MVPEVVVGIASLLLALTGAASSIWATIRSLNISGRLSSAITATERLQDIKKFLESKSGLNISDLSEDKLLDLISKLNSDERANFLRLAHEMIEESLRNSIPEYAKDIEKIINQPSEKGQERFIARLIVNSMKKSKLTGVGPTFTKA